MRFLGWRGFRSGSSPRSSARGSCGRLEQASAERDEEGQLVGLTLTLRPTRHRVIVDGRTVYAWCATDTLMFPVILGRPTIVESACPQTGRAIRSELMPDAVRSLDPPQAVMTSMKLGRHFRGRP
jgi:alkylmercury lyase